jgi:hypothetical protein
LNVIHDLKGYWESNREPVHMKLAKKKKECDIINTLKREGTYIHRRNVFMK